MRYVLKSLTLLVAVTSAVPRGPALAQGVSSIHVCVGVDRVLRFAPGTSCPAGQASYNLALDGTQPNAPDEDKSLPNQINDLKKTIDFLRDRVSNLEKEVGKPNKNESAVEHIVHAPFYVMDKSGKPIFTVTDGVGTQAMGRVRVGRGSGDNYGVWVANAGGTPVLAFSEAKDGAGAVSAYDKDGRRSVQAHGGEGVALFSPSGKSVVGMGYNEASLERGILQLSGIFQIFDGAGQTMVEAGTTKKDGVGVVRVGPGAKCVPMGPLRVGDCIMGRRSP